MSAKQGNLSKEFPTTEHKKRIGNPNNSPEVEDERNRVEFPSPDQEGKGLGGKRSGEIDDSFVAEDEEEDDEDEMGSEGSEADGADDTAPGSADTDSDTPEEIRSNRPGLGGRGE